MKQSFTDIIQCEHPIIMAPMFLVSNVEMITEALAAGITGAIPALNYRTTEELARAIDSIREISNKPFGINLIVNKSNVRYKSQLKVCIEKKVDFIITSLGSPRECIELAKPQGIPVFCDVIDLKYAKIVQELGATGVIAVGSGAGGHAGNLGSKDLVTTLNKELDILIISAGGIALAYSVNLAAEDVNPTYSHTNLTTNFNHSYDYARSGGGASAAFAAAQTGLTLTNATNATNQLGVTIFASFPPA